MRSAETPAQRVQPQVGWPLLIIALATLRADRTLGLTAFAIAPSGPFTGRIGFPGAASLLADMVAVLVVQAVLLIERRLGWRRGRRRLVGLVLVAALVGLQLGAVVATAVTGVAVPDDLYLARALLLTGTVIAALVVLASLAEHRAVTGELRAATVRAEELAAAGRRGLVALREDVSGQVREVLRGALDTLAGPGDPATGARLRALADDVVRPLSHRLARSAPGDVVLSEPVRAQRWRDTFVTVARTPVMPARALALVATGLAWLRTLVTDQEAVRELVPPLGSGAEVVPGTGGPVAAGSPGVGLALTVDWVPLVEVLAELGLILGVTWWAAGRVSAILATRRGAWPPLVSWAVTGACLVGVATLAVLVPMLVGAVSGIPMDRVDLLALLAGCLVLLLVTLGSTLVAAVADGRVALEADLARQRDAAARAAVRLRAVLTHEQQRLARSLHADVQAAVNAAGLILERAAQQDAVTPEVLDEAAGRIATAVERFLTGGTTDGGIVDRLAEVRALWAGVCDVDLDVEQQASARVDADAVTRDLLVDLVAEACANAVVRGGAARVRVRVGLAEGLQAGPVGDVLLVVSDDGTRRTGAGRGGLGSEVLRASCTRFDLDVTPTGATLTASVPLL
jgi:hypothetical protein